MRIANLLEGDFCRPASTDLFRGNLYPRSLADIRTLHAVTPKGSMVFILGWLALSDGAITSQTRKS